MELFLSISFYSLNAVTHHQQADGEGADGAPTSPARQARCAPFYSVYSAGQYSVSVPGVPTLTVRMNRPASAVVSASLRPVELRFATVFAAIALVLTEKIIVPLALHTSIVQ